MRRPSLATSCGAFGARRTPALRSGPPLPPQHAKRNPPRRGRSRLEQLSPRDRPGRPRPDPPHRVPQGNRAPGQRPRQRAQPHARGHAARLGLRWPASASGWPASSARRCAPSPPRPCAKPATATSSCCARAPVLGFGIDVITGREEARLIYQGVAHLLPHTDASDRERRLVVDIGGRSTEMILGQRARGRGDGVATASAASPGR